jgi:hypothetical protein
VVVSKKISKKRSFFVQKTRARVCGRMGGPVRSALEARRWLTRYALL